MTTTKIFYLGRHQAIELPEEFHVASSEVVFLKTADGFMVIPKDRYSALEQKRRSEEVADTLRPTVERREPVTLLQH